MMTIGGFGWYIQDARRDQKAIHAETARINVTIAEAFKEERKSDENWLVDEKKWFDKTQDMIRRSQSNLIFRIAHSENMNRSRTDSLQSALNNLNYRLGKCVGEPKGR